jgi:hypothetical protein
MIRVYNNSQEVFIEQIIKEERSEDILCGEINTPLTFVETILSIIPEVMFSNPELKWLDPACGCGNFMIILYFKLMKGLEYSIINIEARKEHIIKNMIYMIEIQEKNVDLLRRIFGTNANIICADFLKYGIEYSYDITIDVIIGNPPFNLGNKLKVPSSINDKKNDGTTIWPEFVRKSVQLIKEKTGKLCFFIPSLWLKPDKQQMYNFILNYKIEYLNCYSNTESNKIFKGKAQTPSCFFLLTKIQSNNLISIYDANAQRYISYKINLLEHKPIPLFGQEVCNKLQEKNYKTLKVIKTNNPNAIIKKERSEEFQYENVRTCILIGINKLTPSLVIDYSNKKLLYSNIPKIILAHKMYGLPYLDVEGKYGVSNRDNYIIIKEDIKDLLKLQKFLSTKTALYVFEATRYRMKFLEKNAFDLIPDITQLNDFPEEINDDSIAEYFGFNENDKKNIQKLHKKNYNFFDYNN